MRSVSLMMGTGFISNVGGDKATIGLLKSSSSSTSHTQNRNRPRYRILTVPGSWVSLNTANHSRMAARFSSSSVASRPSDSSHLEKKVTACPYSRRVFGLRPSARR